VVEKGGLRIKITSKKIVINHTLTTRIIWDSKIFGNGTFTL